MTWLPVYLSIVYVDHMHCIDSWKLFMKIKMNKQSKDFDKKVSDRGWFKLVMVQTDSAQHMLCADTLTLWELTSKLMMSFCFEAIAVH